MARALKTVTAASFNAEEMDFFIFPACPLKYAETNESVRDRIHIYRIAGKF